MSGPGRGVAGADWKPVEGVPGGRMWLAPGLDGAAWGRLAAELLSGRAAGGTVLAEGRHRVERIALPEGAGGGEAVLKAYGRQAAWRDWAASRFGSKGTRSMAVALRLEAHGVGTPAPLAALELWEGHRLRRCQFVSRWVAGLTDFRAVLIEVLSRKPARCEETMSLLEQVAAGVRALHDAGVAHGDLGNQNIALLPAGEGTWKPLFLDLNRALVRDRLTDAQRGRDLARLDIPSDLRRVFFAMVHGGENPPRAFTRAERAERRAFERHTASRKWRHPFREAKIRARERENPPPRAPVGPELWIWDGRSGQPVQAYVSRDRRKWLPASNVALSVAASLKNGAATRREWKRLMAEPPVDVESFAGNVGVALESEEATDADWERQLGFLAGLDEAGGAKVPVLVRLYRHAVPESTRTALARARALADAGRSVGLALVQDRPAVREPSLWASFVAENVAAAADFAEFFEVGHAPNRSKWGVWDYRESAGLWAPLPELGKKFPGVRFLGPSCIDFEPYAVQPILRQMPRGFRFWAPSAELYVDRRGAPENRQGRHDLRSKAAWLRAAARASGVEWADDRLVVTEVNWPLLGTGPWSPVCSPYDVRGPRKHDPSVTEEDAADFLVRYVRMAIGSGHVLRVYWWRLAAHGFGLVDVPPDGGGWRARPAYRALAGLLGGKGGR